MKECLDVNLAGFFSDCRSKDRAANLQSVSDYTRSVGTRAIIPRFGRPRLKLVSCPRPYFSGTGIGSGNMAYIELFQRNSIIAYIRHYVNGHLCFIIT